MSPNEKASVEARLLAVAACIRTLQQPDSYFSPVSVFAGAPDVVAYFVEHAIRWQDMGDETCCAAVEVNGCKFTLHDISIAMMRASDVPQEGATH